MNEKELVERLFTLNRKVEAHQMVFYAFALAMLSRQADPPEVMRRFRRFVALLEDQAAPEPDEKLLDSVRSLAAGFDQIVQMTIPSTDAQHLQDPD